MKKLKKIKMKKIIKKDYYFYLIEDRKQLKKIFKI